MPEIYLGVYDISMIASKSSCGIATSFIRSNLLRLRCFDPSYSTNSSLNMQVYTNPVSNLVVGVKLFSLTSSGLVLAAQPFLFSKFATMASFAPFLISSLSFAALTPAILHVLTRSCVFKINYNSQTGRFTAYTKTIFLRPKKVEFSLEEVSYSVASLCFANMTVNKKTTLLVLESGFSDPEMKNQLFGLDRPIKFQ
ncbi:Transmembrane protein 70, mitochondrial [Echinococcus granulosus]|uniref:Transmembrane protein 70 n=1 Tax=Echinococcus granulosus TaxID=6210 RepID=A0A068WFG2_ECHGR|nr:Transmembrane protein 70, mitochondrial [Echinococcus granulosus]CDS18817.1 Transmembrane protein 70 [Echinococcus granulosus]